MGRDVRLRWKKPEVQRCGGRDFRPENGFGIFSKSPNDLSFCSNSSAVRVLLIEDERPAALRLEQLLQACDAGIEVLAVLDSVQGSVRWLQEHGAPDLLFLDIQLADGLSFDIFRQVDVRSPIIFTTAFDQYMLKAFRLHSVDYLLKPIDPEELSQALQKYRRFYEQGEPAGELPSLRELMASLQKPTYKERFLIKAGQQITYVAADEVHYFYAEDGLLYLRCGDGKRHVIDYTLDQLVDVLNPQSFFRLSRKVITHVQAIRKVNPYFNNRLVLELHPRPDFQVLVSRDRVADFKAWLDT